MKFYGEPNQLVRERKKKPFSNDYEFKPVFYFDNNGEYETEDEKLIAKLKKKFRYEEKKRHSRSSKGG